MTNTQREKPVTLQIMESLKSRMDLTGNYLSYYYALHKGWEGECQYDRMLEKLTCEHIIMKDLQLKVNRTTIQIDTLVITADRIYLYEIKNYEGSYIYEDERLINCSTGNEILNPIIQLNRTQVLFRQLLKQSGIHLSLEYFVVYINPQFTLYQTPHNQPYVFPNQITAHIKQLNRQCKSLTEQHSLLSERLKAMHTLDRYTADLPVYSYDKLKRGMVCGNCQGTIEELTKRVYYCQGCGFKEESSKSILRHIVEYHQLFPNQKITTTAIQEWCVLPSRKKVRTVLDRYLKKQGSYRWRYYDIHTYE